jgi:hypothetical protein
MDEIEDLIEYLQKKLIQTEKEVAEWTAELKKELHNLQEDLSEHMLDVSTFELYLNYLNNTRTAVRVQLEELAVALADVINGLKIAPFG